MCIDQQLPRVNSERQIGLTAGFWADRLGRSGLRSVAMVMLLTVLSAHAQSPLSITLQPSNYSGYQVSCFGKQNGSINATITGGTAPYQKSWSNGATTEDLSGLPAGYYKLTVMDADSTVVEADITLNEPTQLTVFAEPFTYPNGYNVSCFDCYNGSLDVTVSQGVPPYSFLWNDSITTTQDRSGLGGKKYFVVVKDANQCWVKSENSILTQPERSVWSMGGNTGTNPNNQFIGTTDNKDVVFKSNNIEALRLKADGNIRIWGSDTTRGVLVRDENGVLRGGGMTAALAEILQPPPCTGGEGDGVPYWRVYGNDFTYLCAEDPRPYIGTLNNLALDFRTHNVQRMRITANGAVGIGTDPPAGVVGDYRLYVEDGIVCRDVLVKLGTWPDYVFQPNYALMPMNKLRDFLRTNKHLPGIPSTAELEAKQGVEVADLQARMLKVVEEQALYILELEEKYRDLEQRMQVVETSHK